VKQTSLFSRLTKGASSFAGRPSGLGFALVVIAGWLLLGPVFNFSPEWESVINTCTQLVTFLMVFLIQGSQNRDTEAIQVKLDELIRATKGAHNVLLDLEEMEADDISAFRRRYSELAKQARDDRQATVSEGSPEVAIDQVAGREGGDSAL
jgi:low affinity Fe/Cu permease